MPSKQHLSTEIEQRQRMNMLQREVGRLLEKNVNELEDDVRREMDENEALEINREKDEDFTEKTEDGEVYRESSDEMQQNDFGDDDDVPTYRYQANNRSRDDEYYTPPIANEPSLYDYLNEQINEQELTATQQLIAQSIIGNLDGNGWLPRSPQAIADDVTFNDGVEVETADVEQVLRIVQQLDPPGIAASNLRECMLLQLQRKPQTPDVELATRIISKYFDAFGKKHYDKICTALGVDERRLKTIIDNEILTLDPKPGAGYSTAGSEHSQQITPDFELDVYGDTFQLTLVNNIPELQISQSYSALYERYSKERPVTRGEREAMANVRQKYDRAATYIKVLKMRQNTLYAIMLAIVRRQIDYVLSGDETTLHPLILKDIADDTGYDVSAVSRATTNKYVYMPWGVKPLKFFFNEGLKRNDDQGEVSSRKVQAALLALVAGEDKRHPYSDDRLRELLSAQGYDIARRTVSKYRDVLHIPKAGQRREIQLKTDQ
ncbi:MAG: RNA polymerase factor sigma-54 [Muribaculaceae bacterium]|nr:RNA polymerase factor sigma-54 [Muribaculaceae bacterium]